MPKMEMERRNFGVVELRMEERGEDKSPVLMGHAAVFNQASEDFGGWREKIEPGAFAESIGRDDVRALWNHNSDSVLGRNKANTLRLAEDERGLSIEIDMPDTQTARDLAVSIRRGDVSQMSFGFMVDGKGGAVWEENDDGTYTRTLKKVRLFDVSPVTYPAYPQTDIAVRSLDGFKEQKNVEKRAIGAAQTINVRLRELDLIEQA